MPQQGKVQKYKEKDRQGVYKIAADTAFFGKPIENFLDDRKVFIEFFVKYYLDYESEYTLVAQEENQVVGYLTGCLNTRGQRRRYWNRIIIPGIRNALWGKFSLGRKTWRYAYSLLMGVLRQEYPYIDYEKYPAHLHINVETESRGQGWGRKLMLAYLGQLSDQVICGVHLETTNLNHVARGLYESVGFQLLRSSPTKVWNYLVPFPVNNLVYGMVL